MRGCTVGTAQTIHSQDISTTQLISPTSGVVLEQLISDPYIVVIGFCLRRPRGGILRAASRRHGGGGGGGGTEGGCHRCDAADTRLWW